MSNAYGGQGPNPVQQFTQDVQNFGNSPNTLQDILGQMGASTSPALAQADLQAALAGQQYGLNQQQYGLTTTNLEQQAANQLGQLGISGQQLGLQGQGLQAQAGLLGVTTGIEQQEYGLQQQGYGLSAQQLGLEAQQYPEQLQEAALNYNTNRENLVGNLAASGAMNTVGSTQQQNVLGQQYGWQVADINRAAAGLGLQQQQLGLQQQESVLGQQATTAQQQYSAADIARQQQNLALLAQSNGLSVQEVQQQLGYGLAQSGLDLQQNLPQLLNSLSSIYTGELGDVESAAGAAGLLGGTSLAQIGNNAGVNMYSPGVTNVG
jgi:hypothetical protein